MNTNTRQYIVSLGVKLTQRLLGEDVDSIEEAYRMLIESFHRVDPSPIRLFFRNENNDFEEIYYIHGKEVRKGDDRLSIYQLSADLVANPIAMQREHSGGVEITIPFRHGSRLIGFLQYTRGARLDKDMLETLDVYGHSVSLGLFVVQEKEKSQSQQVLFDHIMKIVVKLRSKHEIAELVSFFINEISSFFRYDRTTAFIYNKQGQTQYSYSINAKGTPLVINNVPEIPDLYQGPQAFDDICGWWLPIKSKDQNFGCILVDNIYTLSSIDAKHLSALEDLCNFVGIIIENMRLFDNIEKIGQTDFLTGIYNRRVGIELINKLIENTNESLNPFTLCYVDLNGLKIVNDTKGHNVGDQMIRDLVDLMKSVVRPGDILSRIGGDEFIILFPDCKMEGAEAAWQRILDEMEVFNKGDDKPYRLRVSHGIAVYNPDSNMTATRLLAIADKRMYKEKTRMNART